MNGPLAADADDMTDAGLAAKNRRVLLVLLGIVSVLLIAGFLVGVRW